MGMATVQVGKSKVAQRAATLREHLIAEFGDASEELVETCVQAKITSAKLEKIDGILGTIYAVELEEFLDEFKALGNKGETVA